MRARELAFVNSVCGELKCYADDEVGACRDEASMFKLSEELFMVEYSQDEGHTISETTWIFDDWGKACEVFEAMCKEMGLTIWTEREVKVKDEHDKITDQKMKDKFMKRG